MYDIEVILRTKTGWYRRAKVDQALVYSGSRIVVPVEDGPLASFHATASEVNSSVRIREMGFVWDGAKVGNGGRPILDQVY